MAMPLLLLCGLVSCLPQEDPNLLNAPGTDTTSTLVRFVNLAYSPRTLRLTNDLVSPPVTVEFSSPSSAVSVSVPQGFRADSARGRLVRTASDTAAIFTSTFRLRLQPRRSFHTVVALANPDSLLVLTNAPATQNPRPQRQAGFRILNAYNDPSVTFSIRLGCPNGTALVQNLAARQLSPQVLVLPENTLALTLVAQRRVQPDVAITLGTYLLSFPAPPLDQNYIIFIVDDSKVAGSIKASLYVLDEAAMRGEFLPITVIPEPTARLRLVNLSSQPARALKQVVGNQQDTIAASTPARSVSPYRTVRTCFSTAADVIVAGRASVQTTLEVNTSYSVLLADSAGGQRAIVVPHDARSIPAGQARVRVVNLAWDNVVGKRSIAAVLGTRSLSNGATSSNGMTAGMPGTINPSVASTGEFLQRALPYGVVSGAVDIQAGTLPLLVFSTEQPQRLLTTAFGQMQSGHRYLLVLVGQSTAENASVYLFDEDAEQMVNQPLEALPVGAFVQMVHAFAGADTAATLPTLRCSMGTSLQNVPLQFSAVISTVLPVSGMTTFQSNIHAASQSIRLLAGQRTLVILAGTSAAPRTLVWQSAPLRPERDDVSGAPRTALLRFINAAPDVPNVKFSLPTFNLSPDSSSIDSTTWDVIRRQAVNNASFASNVIYDSPPLVLRDERRTRILAWNPTFALWQEQNPPVPFAQWTREFPDRRLYSDVNNLLFTMGTAYTIILARTRSQQAQYTLLFVQEY